MSGKGHNWYIHSASATYGIRQLDPQRPAEERIEACAHSKHRSTEETPAFLSFSECQVPRLLLSGCAENASEQGLIRYDHSLAEAVGRCHLDLLNWDSSQLAKFARLSAELMEAD